MFIYAIRRFNLFIITLMILTLVGYSILRLDPTSPWAISDFWQGWWLYLQEISHLNFGTTAQGQPVFEEVKVVFTATLELCFFAFILALCIGLPLGTLAGVRQNKWADRLISFFSMAGYSAPLFWVALLLVMLFSLRLEWLPISGRYNLLYDIPHITGFAMIDAWLSNNPNREAAFASVVMHLVLPALVLALAPTTHFIRIMRASVADVIGNNYIRVAKIKGLSKMEIILQHVLRNAIPPIIPLIGVQLSSMLTFAIITESIFNWPGIGRWLLDAVSNRDYVSIQAGVMVVASFVLATQILSELIGTVINPLARKEWYAKY
ncbi:peptide ABC transporter permease [Vibrio sp. UCD-FRSSP16_10]|uniref:ABC transporter permease n=1 Tax=unclassified Vibrio TaxID=2614977 RepID=UPI0007FFC270|nr:MULTISPECIES: ABC transporter permease subunit [unclassified Vibrio]OBT13894.1 peptide ABC transporter permease [Vibrio sp. UCD-FRSSP16_30]OBT22775.1 peptide ABC transporter permease [Vibrio sp. UCD-FRSSP16_10]